MDGVVRKIDAKFVCVEQVASESAIKLVSSRCEGKGGLVAGAEKKKGEWGWFRWRSEPPIQILNVSHCSRFTRLDLSVISSKEEKEVERECAAR